jgi:hypothetical protein
LPEKLEGLIDEKEKGIKKARYISVIETQVKASTCVNSRACVVRKNASATTPRPRIKSAPLKSDD